MYEKALQLQDMLIAHATNGDSYKEEIYIELRKEFLESPGLRKLVPDFVRSNRTGSSLWSYFKAINPHWESRRQHIWNAFRPLLDYLEQNSVTPSDGMISDFLQSFDPEGVHEAWGKALERRYADPEGAITSARTLLETVCKHILDELNVEYREKDDLPELYAAVAGNLNLAPSQHSEKVFKTILGSTQAIVNNLGTLRNKIGDAHGKGKKPIKPSSRHAALAVNLAGTVATFLIETFLARTTRTV